jgi:hypothetical protein
MTCSQAIFLIEKKYKYIQFYVSLQRWNSFCVMPEKQFEISFSFFTKRIMYASFFTFSNIYLTIVLTKNKILTNRVSNLIGSYA